MVDEIVPATNQAGEVEEIGRRALVALTWANEKLRECGKQLDFSLGMCVTLSDSEKRAEAFHAASRRRTGGMNAYRDALEQISRLRPAGDVETCKNPRNLVEQMETIALAALARAQVKS